MQKLLCLPLLLLLASRGANAETAAEAVVRVVTAAIQNQQQASVFPGLLSPDFKAYVGGWGPSTCEWYNREEFIDHVTGWQSTWATNITLFNIHGNIVTAVSDGTWDVVLNLQIAYLAKPEFGGPAVNAYDVLQVWKVNPQGTQILSFVELSALVLASNSTAMLASTKATLQALNEKNITAVGNAYSSDATVSIVGYQSFDRIGWLKHLAMEFSRRQNGAAFFSQKLYAVCDVYVWYSWTSIEQYNLMVSSDNVVQSTFGYSVLDSDGRIQTQYMWGTGGVSARNN